MTTAYPVEYYTKYYRAVAEPEWTRAERLAYCEPIKAARPELKGLRKLLFDLFG